jgi:hypothetical protein
MFFGFYYLNLGFGVERPAMLIVAHVHLDAFRVLPITLGFRVGRQATPILLRMTTWMFLGFYHLTLGFRVGRPATPIVAQNHLDVFSVLLLDPGFWGWTQQRRLLRTSTWRLLTFYHLTLNFGVGRPATPIVAHIHLDFFRVLPLDPGFQGWTPSNTDCCARPSRCF